MVKNKYCLGLIGENTSYSLSPLIHNTAASFLSLDYSYKGYNLVPQDIPFFLDKFRQEGGLGLNITNPYKKRVAELIGCTKPRSVNTLYSENGDWRPYSTDGEGFWKALLRFGSALSDFEAFCFLGTGDVVDSILSFISSKLRGQLVYFIRRKGHNDMVLKSLYLNSCFLSFTPEALQSVISKHPKKLCLIQATSAPLHGDNLSYLIPALKDFNGLFYELLYDVKSKLYDSLASKGNPILDGLPMLIEQALLSQKIWWKKSASYEKIWSQIMSERKKGAL